MIKNILLLGIILSIGIVSCHCSGIDCETEPPNLAVVLTISGTDPIATGSLALEDIEFKNLTSSFTAFSTYFNGTIGFSLLHTSASYQLMIKNVPVDTFDISIKEVKGECCTSFFIDDIKNNDTQVSFRPVLSINL